MYGNQKAECLPKTNQTNNDKAYTPITPITKIVRLYVEFIKTGSLDNTIICNGKKKIATRSTNVEYVNAIGNNNILTMLKILTV